MPQPRWGCESSVTFPRVARSSQPWALLRNPFGIEDTGKEQRLAGAFARHTLLNAVAALLCASTPCFAQEPMIVPAPAPSKLSSNVHLIDLPTALRLAGAQNLDIQIARERVAEARANDESALWQFFPSLTAGVSYRQHDNLLQDIDGNIISVHKDSYTIGPTFVAQVDLGDAIYRKL